LQEPRPGLLPLPPGQHRLGLRHLDQHHPGLRQPQDPAAVGAVVSTPQRTAPVVMDQPRMAQADADPAQMGREIMDRAQIIREITQWELAAAGRRNTALDLAAFAILNPSERSTVAPDPEAAKSALEEAAARFARGPMAEYAMCMTPDEAWTFTMG
jgi:hypothetical protein